MAKLTGTHLKVFAMNVSKMKGINKQPLGIPRGKVETSEEGYRKENRATDT
jgi:hypothetical protein